jgi:hypothetical protein
MATHAANPNFGRPAVPVVALVTSFEQAVKKLKLAPDQYQRSKRLRDWAHSNKDSKYVPEPLLKVWGFEVDSSL